MRPQGLEGRIPPRTQPANASALVRFRRGLEPEPAFRSPMFEEFQLAPETLGMTSRACRKLNLPASSPRRTGPRRR
jgi:hypothetical protein